MHSNFVSETTVSGRPNSEVGLPSLSGRRSAANARKPVQTGLSADSLRKIVLDLIG